MDLARQAFEAIGKAAQIIARADDRARFIGTAKAGGDKAEALEHQVAQEDRGQGDRDQINRNKCCEHQRKPARLRGNEYSRDGHGNGCEGFARDLDRPRDRVFPLDRQCVERRQGPPARKRILQHVHRGQRALLFAAVLIVRRNHHDALRVEHARAHDSPSECLSGCEQRLERGIALEGGHRIGVCGLKGRADLLVDLLGHQVAGIGDTVDDVLDRIRQREHRDRDGRDQLQEQKRNQESSAQAVHVNPSFSSRGSRSCDRSISSSEDFTRSCRQQSTLAVFRKEHPQSIALAS